VVDCGGGSGGEGVVVMPRGWACERRDCGWVTNVVFVLELRKEARLLEIHVPLQLGWMHRPSCISHHLSHFPGLDVKCACGRLLRGVVFVLVKMAA
jgi:hypothetical protein